MRWRIGEKADAHIATRRLCNVDDLLPAKPPAVCGKASSNEGRVKSPPMTPWS
jgi:hypothetical protein